MPAMAEPGPQLHPGLGLYLQAFEDLSPSRPHGGLGGPAAIPFEAIDRYATRFGVDDLDAFGDLHRFIRALDDAYLDWAAGEAERRSSSSSRT